MIIYLDMDGVIVDYVVSVAQFFDVPLDELYARWPLGVYEVHHGLGKPDKDIWAGFRAAPDEVWTRMPDFPWARDLFNKCNEKAKTFILSSPINSPTCVSGKVKWLHNYFGPTFYDYILTHWKYNCAAWDHILIDDKEANVTEWEKHGGEAILFPNHGNRLHPFKKDPLAYVLPELERIEQRINCKAAERAILFAEMMIS